jgi:hypothetical protein
VSAEVDAHVDSSFFVACCFQIESSFGVVLIVHNAELELTEKFGGCTSVQKDLNKTLNSASFTIVLRFMSEFLRIKATSSLIST